MKIFTTLWNLFTSVQLAIATLISLALTSIIGTVIPQGESAAWYSHFFAKAASGWFGGEGSAFVQRFADSATRFTILLQLDDMYSSWWYTGLLTVLALSLIICTIDRFPLAWKLIHKDNLAISSGRLQKMQLPGELPATLTFERAAALLADAGWQGEVRKEEGRTLFFAQKGRWGRMGVYLVHLSILVIFLGGIIGSLLGFRATVWVPELESVHTIYTQKGNLPIQLPFDLHCNWFGIQYYDSGMPKEYESSLTLVENQKELLTRKIEVNGPMKYNGMTFYQASYQPIQGSFVITLRRKVTQDGNDTVESFHFIAEYQKLIPFEAQNLKLGILAAQGVQERAVQEKLWIKSGTAAPWSGWLDDNQPQEITLDGQKWEVRVKQRFATGLQVAKDPGVWLVYLGCLLMLCGLYLAFFMPHRRLWLLSEGESRLLLAANSNKNKSGFARETEQLMTKLTAE